MTNEEKTREIVSRNIPNDDYDNAASYEHCKLMLMEMAQWKDGIYQNEINNHLDLNMTKNKLILDFKHHADAMYFAMQNLSTDASQVRKAMKDYHSFLFTDYYTD